MRLLPCVAGKPLRAAPRSGSPGVGRVVVRGGARELPPAPEKTRRAGARMAMSRLRSACAGTSASLSWRWSAYPSAR